MAEDRKPPEMKKPLIDGSVIGDIMTLVLCGSYAMKRGRLTPNEAMSQLIGIGARVERGKKMSVAMKRLAGAFIPVSKS